MPLGISPDESWAEHQLNLDEHNMLVLYTDGILEGIDITGQLYGQERMLKVLRGKGRMTARQITQALLDSFNDFIGEQPQFDDIGLIVLRRAAE
jgi:sigma-B regulation protein RsbU (phosphoserine phosphatase)